jgi:hypothetical protein
MPTDRINDAQPGMSETDRTLTVDPDIVGSSVADSLNHLP